MWNLWQAPIEESQHKLIGFWSRRRQSVTDHFTPYRKYILALIRLWWRWSARSLVIKRLCNQIAHREMILSAPLSHKLEQFHQYPSEDGRSTSRITGKHSLRTQVSWLGSLNSHVFHHSCTCASSAVHTFGHFGWGFLYEQLTEEAKS